MSPKNNWIRLARFGDSSEVISLPTQKIQTFAEAIKVVYEIFEFDPDAFSLDLHVQNASCEGRDGVLALPRLWDLGLYFSDTPGDAMMIYAHFRLNIPSLTNIPESSAAPVAPMTPQHQHQHQHQHQSQYQSQYQPQHQPQHQSQHEPQLQQQEQHEPEEEKAESSVKKREITPVDTTTKRARGEYWASEHGIDQTQSRDVRFSEEVEAPKTPVVAHLSEEDDEYDSLFNSPNTRNYDESVRASMAPISSSPLGSLQFSPSTPSAIVDAVAAAVPVTLKISFKNEMKRSHKVKVPAWETKVDGDVLLSDYEKDIKNKIRDEFLCCAGISERQSNELARALAIKVFVNKDDEFDVLRERKTIAEYLVGDVGAEDDQERVLSLEVQMHRKEDIEQELWQRLSPTLENEDEDEDEDEDDE